MFLAAYLLAFPAPMTTSFSTCRLLHDILCGLSFRGQCDTNEHDGLLKQLYGNSKIVRPCYTMEVSLQVLCRLSNYPLCQASSLALLPSHTCLLIRKIKAFFSRNLESATQHFTSQFAPRGQAIRASARRTSTLGIGKSASSQLSLPAPTPTLCECPSCHYPLTAQLSFT